MSRLFAVALGLAALLACEATTSSAPFGTSAPRGLAATQVGSEGYWSCGIDGTTPIADPLAPIEGFGVPADVTAELLGSWALTIVDERSAATAGGSLELASGDHVWVDVREDTGCEDHVVAAVEATLVREGSAVELSGTVGARPGDGLFVLASADLDAVATGWGKPNSTEASGFRVEGSLAPTALEGVASFGGCGVSDLDCPVTDLVATLAGAR